MLDCTDISLELLVLEFADQPLRVLIFMFIFVVLWISELKSV